MFFRSLRCICMLALDGLLASAVPSKLCCFKKLLYIVTAICYNMLSKRADD